MTSPFSPYIHPFPIKNCSIYNSTVLLYQSGKHLMPVCAVDNFLGELNIAAPVSSWPRPTTIFKKSNFNHGACLKFPGYPNEIWHACCTNTVKPASQISGEISNSYWFIGHLKCTATQCVDSQLLSVRRWVKSGITPQGIPDKMTNY